MKTSNKTLALILGITALSLNADAQEKIVGGQNNIIYSIGIGAGISTGEFEDLNKWHIGGSLQADIPIAKKLYVTVNAGYANFFGNNDGYGPNKPATDIHLLPVKVGLKYFPLPHFYVQGEAGAGFLLNRSDLGYDKSAAFVYGPQVGIQFPVGEKSYIDAGARYERSTDYNDFGTDSKINYFGLRVSYAFAL